MPNCKKCKAPLDVLELEFKCEESLHDHDSVEINFNCPHCKAHHYAFVEMSDFQAS